MLRSHRAASSSHRRRTSESSSNTPHTASTSAGNRKPTNPIPVAASTIVTARASFWAIPRRVNASTPNPVQQLEKAVNYARRAINLLQATAATGAITANAVYETAARAKPQEVRRMLETALAGDFAGARKATRTMREK